MLAISVDARPAILAEYDDTLKRGENEAKKQEAANAAHRRKLAFYGVVGGAIVVVLIIAVMMASSYLSRKHFSSVDSMKDAIAGVYTGEGSGSASAQLKIENEGMIWRADQSDASLDINLPITSYDPGNGSFIAGGNEIIVTSDGDIQYLSSTYRRGGSWATRSTYTTDSNTTKYETASSALSINGTISKSGGSYTEYNGTIKNNGSRTYSFVKVKGSFKNSSGSVVDTDWTYAVGSEGLSPGESKTFSLSVKKNSSIKDCSISVIGYRLSITVNHMY